MEKKIRLVGLALLSACWLSVFCAAQTERRANQSVVITVSPGARLPEGDHQVVFIVGGRRVSAQLKVTSSQNPSEGPATAGASSSGAPAMAGDPSVPTPLQPPSAAVIAEPTWPTWLVVTLAILGTLSLLGAGAWGYFKVYLPRKQIRPYREALRLVRDREYERALPILSGVESKLPDGLRREARFFIAFCYYRLKETKQAEFELSKLRNEDPKDANAAYLLAYLRVEQKHYDDAEPVLTAMEGHGQLGLFHAKKLLGIVQFRRALAALKEGYVDGAAELFEKVEALGDYAAQIPGDLRNRNIALGTKALFDKDFHEARRQFNSLEQAAAKVPDEQRMSMLTAAKLGLALAAWVEDTAEADEQTATLLTEAVKLFDPDDPLERTWPEEGEEQDLAGRLAELEAKDALTAEERQRERCLRDLHFLRGMLVLRAWRRLDGSEAHAQLASRYEQALSRFACARARDPQFSDVFLVVGLLMYYFHKPGPERGQGVKLLSRAQKYGMNEPDAVEIINNRARIERANADAVTRYLEMLDKYLGDETVRAEVRRSLLDRLGRHRRFTSLEKRPGFKGSRRVEPSVAEVMNRSEILRVRVEQIIATQGDTDEVRQARRLSESILQDGQLLYKQAQGIEEQESELLALTGTQLFKD